MTARAAYMSSYVPAVTAARLASRALLPGTGPVGQSTNAAVLFADIAGFTGITETLEQKVEGLELLANAIDTFFGQLIDRIASFGGDVLKFGGDSLLATWPADAETIGAAVTCAAACALDIARTVGTYRIDSSHRMQVKLVVTAGEVSVLHVGGADGQWNLVVAGSPLDQISEVSSAVLAGQVGVSSEACEIAGINWSTRSLRPGANLLLSVGEPAECKPLSRTSVADCEVSHLQGHIPRAVLARSADAHGSWLAELRPVTVAFLSISGLEASCPDFEVQLQRVASVLQSAVARYGGAIHDFAMHDKGPIAMASFGLPPEIHEDDPLRAIRTSIAMMSDIAALHLSCRAGVATGRVFCGPIGNDNRREYAVYGDAVILAARLALAAPHAQLVCDESTMERVQGRVQFTRLPAFLLKGKSGPVAVFSVQSDAATHLSPPVVGRERELALAESCLRNLAATGKGGVLVVEGDPGIGKSRLVQALRERKASLGISWLYGAADGIERSTPYYVWRTVFAELLNIEDLSDPREIRRRLAAELEWDPELPALLPLLDSLVPVDVPDNDLTRQLTGERRANNTQLLLCRLLQRKASAARLVVVLEDGHWFDSASWSLALQVARDVRPLLLVVTIRPMAAPRPEEFETLLSSPATRRVELRGLPPQGSAELVGQLAGAGVVSAPVAGLVERRAEGNPFYIQQLFYSLRDRGLVQIVDGEVRLTGEARPTSSELSSEVLPNTVYGLVASRIGQLDSNQELTLKVASVIGRSFASALLREVHPLRSSQVEIDHQLGDMVLVGILRPVGTETTREYMFGHSITQEVAYGLMPADQRRQLHRAVAECLEQASGDNVQQSLGTLAYHWQQAGDGPKAASYLGRAGEAALAEFANEEAVRFLSAAIDVSGPVATNGHELAATNHRMKLGEAYVNWSKYREGAPHLEYALGNLDRPIPGTVGGQVAALAREAALQLGYRFGIIHGGTTKSDRHAEFRDVSRAYARLAEIYYFANDTPLTLLATFRTLNVAERAGISPELAIGRVGLGLLSGMIPFHRIARSYIESGLDVAIKANDAAGECYSRMVAALYYGGVGNWSRATELVTAVADLADRLRDRRRYRDAMSNFLVIEYYKGAFAVALGWADRLHSESIKDRDARYQADALVWKALCQLRLGRDLETRNTLSFLKGELSDRIDHGNTPTRLLRLATPAVLAMRDGRQEEAVQLASSALEVIEATYPSAYDTLPAYDAVARVALDAWERQPRSRALRSLATRACAALEKYSRVFPIGKPRALIYRGCLDWLYGRKRKAVRAWEHAAIRAVALSMEYDVGLSRYEAARHLPRGHPMAPGAAVDAARIFERCGASFELERCRDLVRDSNFRGAVL